MLVYGRASTKARMAWNEAIFMIFLRWFSGVHSRHRPPLVMNSSGKFSRSAWPPQGLVTKTFLFYWFSRIVVKGLNVLNAQLSCVSVLLMVSWDCCRDPRRPLRPVDGVLGLLQSCWSTSLQPSQAIWFWPCNLDLATESSDSVSGRVDWCTLGPLHFWLLVTYLSGLLDAIEIFDGIFHD